MDSFPALTGAQIVDQARTWVGTPWHHDARVKGVGVDCIGLVAGVFAELGVPVNDVRGYGRGDEFERMNRELEKYGLLSHSFAPGHVLVFRNCDHAVTPVYNHVGIFTGDGMIHAWNGGSARAVVEMPLSPFWESCLVAGYRYRGAI